MLHLHDTSLGRVVAFEPRTPGRVSMYVCGPTVQGEPHLGHGRFSLVFDVLRRYLEWSGFEVHYVSNVTDIDDKIIARAAAEGRSHEEVAAQYEAVWWDAMDRLNVKRPDDAPHATAYVEQMVELIGRLVAVGAAYETADGVYFRPALVGDYGLLARQSLDSLRAGARVEANEDKESPVDFVLWKKAKPGEPSWPSPWGDGRPGWHTECVVMSLDLLGDGFDLHGGGQDLAFPHHENERAQALALGHTFARHWVHNGWVVDESGEKMSKSVGNVTTLLDLVERHDPRSYRLLVLQAHYRSPIEVNASTVTRAEATLRRLDEFARNHPPSGDVDPDPSALERFRAAMDDDLGTPGAVGVLFELVTRANGGDAPAAAAAHAIAAALGLVIGGASEDVPPEVAAVVARRDAARAARDWAVSDALRDQLEAAGWTVKDTPEGTSIHR